MPFGSWGDFGESFREDEVVVVKYCLNSCAAFPFLFLGELELGIIFCYLLLLLVSVTSET